MSVGENIEYGLRVRGVQPAQRRSKAIELLELVRLPHTYERRIHQLSGGERQRIALARALAPRPAILLLDEPMGALDEKLRLEMQVELKELQRRLGMTFIYVTHSQEEALTMSDRVVLMAQGRIVQEGSPYELFQRPNSRFAATFMGVENIRDGIIERAVGDVVWLRIMNNLFQGHWSGRDAPVIGQTASVAVRAEKVRIDSEGTPERTSGSSLSCTASQTVYKGKYVDQLVDSPIGPIVARIWNAEKVTSPPARVWWRDDDCLVVPYL